MKAKIKSVLANTLVLSDGRKVRIGGVNVRRVLGEHKLKRLVKDKEVDIDFTDEVDRYGRSVVSMRATGLDVGDWLLANGYGDVDDERRRGTDPFAIEKWRGENAYKGTA